MRTFRYSHACPDGKIFDTEPGKPDPYPPPTEAQGWFDHPVRGYTQDELIERVVKEELAKQDSNRIELEAEFRDKSGQRPHFAAQDKTLTKYLDDNRAKERKRR